MDALERVRAAASAQRRLPARFDLTRLDRMLSVCRINEQAAAAHVPAYYAGTVHAFRSADAAGPDAWAPFCDEVVVHPVPADHHTIMSPSGYPLIAAQLRRLLAEPVHQEQP